MKLETLVLNSEWRENGNQTSDVVDDNRVRKWMDMRWLEKEGLLVVIIT